MPRIHDRVERALAEVESTCSLAVLSQVLPPSLIEETLRSEGISAKRRRKLPPDVVTWLVVAMALFRNLRIETVLRRVIDGIAGFTGFGSAELPCATSIAHARDRLGWNAVRVLFERLVAIVVPKHAKATTWRGLPLYTLDGTCFLMPDTKANDAHFGRPGSSRGGRSGFPQLRAAFLIAAYTHLVAKVAVGAFKRGELTLAADLLAQIEPGSLVLMDRAYFAFAWLADLASKGAFFVVRVKTGKRDLRPKKGRALSKNDRLAELVAPSYLKRKRPDLADALGVRLVTYRWKGFRPVVLATNLLDPTRFPAAEIAVLYHDRWEAELSYRELKIHQAEKKVTFRSHTPDRILQEFYALLLAYTCVRALIAEAATEAGVPPRRLSFTDCLQRIRATLPLLGALSERQRADTLAALLAELARQQLPPRRSDRRYPRAVKIKMSNYARKRAVGTA